MKIGRLPCHFQLGETVYHRTETDGEAGMIVMIHFDCGGGVVYTVQWGQVNSSRHFELELTKDRTFGQAVTSNTKTE